MHTNRSAWGWRRVHKGLACALLAVLLSQGLHPAQASNPDGDLRIEVLATYNLVVDSNIESPSATSPNAATLGARFCNDGANPLTHVFATIGDDDPNGDLDPADSAPGIYPSRTNPPTGQVGTFALIHEGGTSGLSDAVRFLDTIAPGACVTQYWLVSYPWLDANGDSLTRDASPADDLWLEFDVWAEAEDAGTPLAATVTRRLTLRSQISASANKIWPTTNSKVPPEYLDLANGALGWAAVAPDGSNTTTPGDVITTQGLWYDLGNVNQGLDNDGDLVPDQNVWLQPIGVAARFDPGCYRLSHTYGLLIVSLIGGGEQLIPFEDQLYFANLPPNNGVVGLIYYEFVGLGENCGAGLTPYQTAASGPNGEKYNADFGYNVPAMYTSAAEVTLTTAVDKTAIGPALPDSLSYTLSFENTSAVAAGKPDYGTPLVLQNAIPAGTTYVPGSAAAGNSIPPGIAGITTLFSCDGGASWTTEECSGVTHLQWWLSDALPPGAAGAVTFQVSVPSGYSGITVVDTGAASWGHAPPFAEDTVVTFILGENSLGDLAFADDGAGGGTLGNGVMDGGEAGLGGIAVTLHYDANGNGDLDDADLLWDVPGVPGGVTTSAPDGSYLFTDLPDGHFLASVDMTAAGIPAGYTHTAPPRRPVALDAGGAVPGPMAALEVDFGFAPALAISNDVAGNGHIYADRLAQFTVSLSNRLPGSGSANDPSCRYTTWATLEDALSASLSANKRFSNSSVTFLPPTNAFGNGGPDGLTASADYSTGANQILAGTGYGLGTYPGAINRVEAVFQLHLQNALVDDFGIGTLFFNGAPLGSQTFATGALNQHVGSANAGLLAWDVTGLRPWTWGDFAGNLVLQYGNEKAGSGDTGRLFIDAIGFRITSDQTCPANDSVLLDPGPVSYAFDESELVFLSAEPPADIVGAGTIVWQNLVPLYPGQTKNVVLTFRALEPTTNPQTVVTIASADAPFYADGRPANPESATATATLWTTGSIAGTIWSEGVGGTAGWVLPFGYEAGTDSFVAGVHVTLYACVHPLTGTFIFPGDMTRNCTSPQNGGAWQPVATQATAGGGTYRFDGLQNGYYIVEVDAAAIPGSEIQTGDPNRQPGACGNACDDLSGEPSADIGDLAFGIINTGNDIDNVNFGYSVPPALFGSVWHDGDGDGLQEGGENGLAGVTVNLMDAACAVVANSAVTDAAGGYAFGDLAAGTTYCLRIAMGTLPGAPATGWLSTAETDGSPNNQMAAFAQMGVLAGPYAFGFTAQGSSTIGDMLYFDWDGDGSPGVGDEGIAGITIWLHEDTNGDGQIDAAQDALLALAVTDSAGVYAFADLPAGHYIVSVDRLDPSWPAGFNYSQSGDPDEIGRCSICNNRGTALVDGTNANLDLDFGYAPTGNGSIGDTVWTDRDSNGLQAGFGEPGLAGVTVILAADPNGDALFTPVAVTTTDATGRYQFAGLPLVAYQVRVDPADPAIPLDAQGVPYAPTTPLTRPVTLSTALPDAPGIDFGFAPLASLGGTLFWDTDGNGTQDWDEPGLDGVLVSLYEDSDGNGLVSPGVDNLIGASTTATVGGEAGRYFFHGLHAGDYVLQVDSAPGDAPLTADPDADGVSCSDPAVAPVCDGQVALALRLGDALTGADFGFQPTGILGDSLWLDADGDGLVGAGETGLAYVTVVLSRDDDGDGLYETVVATGETDGSGSYGFAALTDGTYRVTVDAGDPDLPANLSPTSDADGTADGVVNAIVISGGSIATIGGAACPGCDMAVDFGYRYAGTHGLSGTVCKETAVDGVCGAGASGVGTGEQPYVGTPVYLRLWQDDGDGFVASGELSSFGTAWTAANGDYAFAGLPAGTYLVSLSAPAGDIGLTTTAGNHPAVTQIVETATATGLTISAYQVVAVSADVTGLDFAFEQRVYYDYGDLPALSDAGPTAYSTALSANSPRHGVPPSPALYLGWSPPDTEPDGLPTFLADGDGYDEDGVFLGPGPAGAPEWANGPGGGTLSVFVHGTGWLVVYIDFNNDGDFHDTGEIALSSAVDTGMHAFSIDVPANSFCPDGAYTCTTAANPGFVLYIRARLFAAPPPLVSVAYAGTASAGEVEDYRFPVTPTAVRLQPTDAGATNGAAGIWLALTAALGIASLAARRRVPAGRNAPVGEGVRRA